MESIYKMICRVTLHAFQKYGYDIFYMLNSRKICTWKFKQSVTVALWNICLVGKKTLFIFLL